MFLGQLELSRRESESAADSALAITDYRRIATHEWIATLVFTDLLGAIVISLLIFGVHVETLSFGSKQLWAALGGFVIAWMLASHSRGLYRRETLFASRRTLLIKVTATCALAFGLILLLGFGLKVIGGVSRVWLLAWAASAFVWVLFVRLAAHRRLETRLREGCCLDRVLVLGGSLDAAGRAADILETESGYQIRVVATAEIADVSSKPLIDIVETEIRRGRIDRVFVTEYDGLFVQTNALIARLTQFAVDVTLLPELRGLQVPFLRVARIGMLPTFDVVCRPLTSSQAMIKRLEDVILAGTFLILSFPVLLLIALAVKLDSRGPVFFRQARLGFHDRVFHVWKFRTMYHEENTQGPFRQTSKNDSRVTRVGFWLRKTSLDELPQLFNVIRGEMSIVGPRPHAVSMTTEGRPLHAVLDSYASRHRIKPGITGWAQVNGCRGEVNAEEKLRQRVRLDCQYIENWSIALDAWIILRTIRLVVTDQHAY